jgi:hypothetical protein
MSGLSILLTLNRGSTSDAETRARDHHKKIFYDYFTERNRSGDVTRKIVIAWRPLGENKVEYGACIFRRDLKNRGETWIKKNHRNTATMRLYSGAVVAETNTAVNPGRREFKQELRRLLYSRGCGGHYAAVRSSTESKKTE